MKIGRSHKWYYNKGEWRDHKITPDLWEIEYKVTKRRAGKAPEGSGVPIGTEYHWYILAHQHVKKLDANSYSTTLAGLKYKLAHKRFDNEKWNISDAAQRKRLIKAVKANCRWAGKGLGRFQGRNRSWEKACRSEKNSSTCEKEISSGAKEADNCNSLICFCCKFMYSSNAD